MKISRNVEFGTQAFTASNGDQVVPAYGASVPCLLMIPLHVYRSLMSRQISSLGSQHVAVLVANGIIDDDGGRQSALDLARAQRRQAPRVRTFTLLPTSYCNMGCAYCGQEHIKGVAASDHREAVRRRVSDAIESGRWDRVHVQWFGGEPLLAYSVLLDLAAKFTQLGQGSSTIYDSQLTTNGSLLTIQKVDQLVLAGVNRFDITLDGPARTHNVSRRMKNGSGTFDRIVAVVSSAAQTHASGDVKFILRTNLTRQNMHEIPEYLEEVARFASGRSNIFLDLAPIHEWGNDVDALAANPSDIDQVELELFRLMHKLGLQFGMLPSELATTTCVATDVAAEVIDRDGRMYSCVEYPLVPGQRDSQQIGQVLDLLPHQPRPADVFSGWHASPAVDALPCGTCSLNPVCGGGCPKLWVDTGQGCPSFRRTVRQRLDLAAEFAGYLPAGPLPNYTPMGA